MAVVEAMKKTNGDTDTNKLIAAMEGMSFETPKGRMTFRKEDHQAMQSMYHFKIKVDRSSRGACPSWCARSSPKRCRCRSATSADCPPPPRGEGASHWRAVLETRELTIRFGGHVAVDAVSCTFHPGTLTAIVGPNGAGKTTYFNLISGQLKASAGSVHLDGTDITGEPVSARTHRGLGRAFQLTQLFPNLSVTENVRLAVQSRRREGLDLWSVWSDRRETLARAPSHWSNACALDRIGQRCARQQACRTATSASSRSRC